MELIIIIMTILLFACIANNRTIKNEIATLNIKYFKLNKEKFDLQKIVMELTEKNSELNQNFKSRNENYNKLVQGIREIGDTFFNKKDYNTAKEIYFFIANNIYPGPNVLNMIGLCYSKLGDKKTAIDYYSKAISEKNDFTVSYFNRGCCYYTLKNYDQALKDFRKAKSLGWENFHGLLEETKNLLQQQIRPEDSEYTRLISSSSSFDEILNNCKKSMMVLSESDKEQLFNQICHGEAILESDVQLKMYIYAYGNMHKHKLIAAFNILKSKGILTENLTLDVIDYGCGQALASSLFAEYCSDNDINVNIENLLLVDPSVQAVSRGLFHINQIKGDSAITQIKTKISRLDDLESSDLTTKNSTLHLFSNILDIENYDIQSLCLNISYRNSKDFFICVSPYYPGRIERIDNFYRYFNSSYQTELYSKRSSQRWRCKERCCDNCPRDDGSCSQRPWTRYEYVFKVDFSSPLTCNDHDIPF